MTHKNRKNSKICMFLSTGCSLLRAEGLSCSLGVLYGGLGISKLQFLIKKIENNFQLQIFFNFRSSNPGSGSGIRIRNYKKCWIRIRIRIRIKSMRIRNPVFFINRYHFDVPSVMKFYLVKVHSHSNYFVEKKPGQKSQLPCTAGGCPVPPGPPLVAAVLISPPTLK
jgi:hypothetical protein